MPPISKDTLLTAKLPRQEVEVNGGTVIVRSLSRAEVMSLQDVKVADALEIQVIAIGMVDPSLTADEVTEWRAAASSVEVAPVSDAILALSGLTEGAQADKERSFRPGPGESG